MDRKTQEQSAKGACLRKVMVAQTIWGVRPALSIGACRWWSVIPRGWSASRCRRLALELYGLIINHRFVIVNYKNPLSVIL